MLLIKGRLGPPVPRGTLWSHAAALLAFSAVLLAALPVAAQNATWNLNGSGDFNTGGNWTPGTVPTATAFFGASNQNNVSFSANIMIGGWTFNAGASNYTFTNSQILTFTGAGLVVNGGSAAINGFGPINFNNASTAGSAVITDNNRVQFNNTSTAGSATINNNGNFLNFFDTSTAGSATINNNAAMAFLDASTAGNATIHNNLSQLGFSNTSTAGSATIISNGSLVFVDTSTAGSAKITNNNQMIFSNASTAGSATITNNSTLFFFNSGTGGTARFINGAGGSIDLSDLATAGITAGSIEGAGKISLGSKNLAVGGNNLSTTFSGVLADSGAFGGIGGSLTKTGSGALTLSGTNTYTGNTIVDGGSLLVNGSIATSALTTVNSGGTLGGTGTVGATQVNAGGTFAPGSGAPGSSMTV